MKDQLYNQMLSAYPQGTADEKRNAVFEVNQQVVLCGLYNAGFFNEAAFYGGTCLRIFHGLRRFSEDLDFSLLSPNEAFCFENYFQPVLDQFAELGRKVEIKKKHKHNFGKVESAFLKDNTDVYNISFQHEKSIKIKIEVDTMPPPDFRTEQRLLLQPQSFMTRCYTLSDLFAGKMHALAYRAWKNRIKGRDWYDFEWYVRNGVPLGFKHLAQRVRQFNGEEIDKQTFLLKLKERLQSSDINLVKEDVIPFIRDAKEMDIWSNDYFVQLAQMMRFEE